MRKLVISTTLVVASLFSVAAFGSPQELLVSTSPPVETHEPCADVASPDDCIRMVLQDELNLVRFKWGSTSIDPASFGHIERIAQILDNDQDITVMIVGHTDNTGSKMFNLDLSLRRAAAVKVAISRRGIDRYRLSIDGAGPTHPVATNATSMGRSLNRRIEIKVRVWADDRADEMAGTVRN